MICIYKLRDHINDCNNCGRAATIQLFVERKFDRTIYIDLCNKCKNLFFKKIEEFKIETEKENG